MRIMRKMCRLGHNLSETQAGTERKQIRKQRVFRIEKINIKIS